MHLREKADWCKSSGWYFLKTAFFVVKKPTLSLENGIIFVIDP